MNPKALEVKKGLLAILLGKQPNMVYYSFSKDKTNYFLVTVLFYLGKYYLEYHRLV